MKLSSLSRHCCTSVISLCLSHRLIRNEDSSALRSHPVTPPLLMSPLKLTLYKNGSSVWSKQKGTGAFEASFLFIVVLLWNSASGFLWRNLPSFYHNQDSVCFWHGQSPVDDPWCSPDRHKAGDPRWHHGQEGKENHIKEAIKIALQM